MEPSQELRLRARTHFVKYNDCPAASQQSPLDNVDYLLDGNVMVLPMGIRSPADGDVAITRTQHVF